MSRDTQVRVDMNPLPSDSEAGTANLRETLRLTAGATPAIGQTPRTEPYNSLEDLSPLPIGSRIAGFEIDRYIGFGNHHGLYRAVHPNLPVPVVLKTAFTGDPLLRQMLHRQLENERDALARINHPNIVRLWDYLPNGDQPALVLEYVAGESLADRLLRPERLQSRKVLRVACEIVAALEALTQGNLIHRDVKPGNIMLLPNGRAKLIDFGLAVEWNEEGFGFASLELGDQLGSPAYMAPEQYQREPLDCRADIYALGATLYECLTGKLPFDSPDVSRLALRHIRETPLSPHAADRSIPKHLSDIAMRFLSKKPADRMGDHAALVRELTALHEAYGAANTP